ncbi:UNVERIFIED_CONTAM: hypothetical protein PYX00_008183 [Menopon gallinae]|uniref:Epimerase family protein SDR39U1 n=1 Tax=Menopon gallinae TaxID=328185 RepID=A0AAW2HMN0_9NEOP
MTTTYTQVLVGGGSGFIGRHLMKSLNEKGYGVTIVSRIPGSQRISWDELRKSGLPKKTTAVVSLAGQNVLDPKKRWTPGFKQNVWTSRVNTTMALAQACLTSSVRPKVFVSISGVGIYSPSQTVEYTEESQVKEFDFLSQLCHAWEGAANSCSNIVRTVIIRSGVVLGKNGGMVKQLWLPFFLGLGGPVGPGNQYLPWIHIDDLTNLILYAIENEKVKGVLNGVAPDVITNKEFSTAFAKAMSRPALFQIPTFALNLALSEERAKIMTEGQKVLPKKTLETGFQFKYPRISDAVQEIVSKS